MRPLLRQFLQFDGALLLSVFTLMLIGLLAVYGIGTSNGVADLFQFKKQLIAVILGVGIMIGMSLVDYRSLRAFALPVYLVGAVLLLAVLIFGVTINGTQGWFVIGKLSFQPVEISKVTLIFFLAAYLSRHARKRLDWMAVIGSAIPTLLYVGLILLQPDFGSAVVLCVIWGACIAFVGLPRRAWLVLGALALVGGPLLWGFGLKPYQRARFESFVNPTVDPRGSGYNVTQARIAIGSGGLLGKGIGEGSQARLRFLPEASTDFIFAVIGEELGFVGVSIVIGLFGLFFSRLLVVAGRSTDLFAQILLIAMMSLFGFHVFVNAGMNLGVMPVTGIPLPFVSAAASSLVVTSILVGLAHSIAVHQSSG